VAIIAVIGIAGADLSGLLAGGVVTGLVLGIALQPVLSNFFAGILLMTTKMVEIGSRARILSTSIPFSMAILPAYKYFSVDFVEAGYKGTIVDINFFYTRMVTDEGREIKIPNIVLMNSSIVDYAPEFSEREIINLRVEMPLANIDLESLEDKIREALTGFQIEAGPYFNEQSDKEHVIILVKLSVPVGQDWRKVKSEALKRLLILRKRIIEASAIQRSAAQL
jgi:Small-conductance mechanosensitive channel